MVREAPPGGYKHDDNRVRCDEALVVSALLRLLTNFSGFLLKTNDDLIARMHAYMQDIQEVDTWRQPTGCGAPQGV